MAGLEELIVRGGQTGPTMGEAMLSVEKLKSRQKELAVAKDTARASLENIMLKRQAQQQETQKQQMRADIISGSYSNAMQLGAPEAFPAMAIESAAAAGDIELIKELRDAYAPAKKAGPKSKIGKLQADLAAATNPTERKQLQDAIRAEKAKGTTAEVKAEEVGDEQAWQAISNVFPLEGTLFGNELKEPGNYYEVQQRYKELYKEDPSTADQKIQEEYTYEPEVFGPGKMKRSTTNPEEIFIDFTQ